MKEETTYLSAEAFELQSRIGGLLEGSIGMMVMVHEEAKRFMGDTGFTFMIGELSMDMVKMVHLRRKQMTENIHAWDKDRRETEERLNEIQGKVHEGTEEEVGA